MYLVGQNYPVQEVPRPQARKITQSLKARLMAVALRYMNADPGKRLHYDKLRKHFPMFTDLQIKQKLKEFAQYLKKGENTGWWKLKASIPLPDEDAIRKIITPEMVCLIQSTLVGQQRLKDAGYAADDYSENVDENVDEESHLDIEIQLAPWITTKNFVIAASGKGMLKLFGPGDPTGCGEGFSYVRASMKEMFFKSGDTEAARSAFIDAKAKATFHKYSIIEQQIVYKAEIERIWSGQMKTLTATAVKPAGESDKALEKMRAKKQVSNF
jgi:transcription initiation factor TFIID subunit 1, fungi type